MKLSTSLFFPVTLCVAMATTVLAATGDDHHHTPLAENRDLNYSNVLQMAIDHAPEIAVSQPRADQARAYQKLGKSVVLGNPALTMSYYDDRLHDDTGMEELDAALEWKLWAWGARSNTRTLGENLGLEFDAWQNYLKLAVAGKIRNVMADIRENEVSVEQARNACEQANQLKMIAEKRYQSGDVPKDAVLQAEYLVIETNSKLLEARASLVDAERNYQFLTGLSERPAVDLVESEPEDAEVTPDHPLLAFLKAQIETASTRIASARHDVQGNPTVSIGLRRERPDHTVDYADSVSIGFSYPLGGGRLSSARVSDANLAKTDAQVEYDVAYRRLRQDLHEVEHELQVANEQLALAKKQWEIAAQRVEMGRKAFEEGENTMTQVIQALQQSQELNTRYQMISLRRQRLISMLNQTLGFLP